MTLPRKDIVFPDVTTDRDDGDPGWEGGQFQEQPDGMFLYRRQPGQYAESWELIRKQWTETAAEYETEPDGFFEAWHYLDGHPAFWTFRAARSGELPRNHVAHLEYSWGVMRAVEITVVRVDPATETIEGEQSRNTAVRVCCETGHVRLFPDEYGNASHWHDPALDGGAVTYEQAIIGCARRVWQEYGNDRRVCDAGG